MSRMTHSPEMFAADTPAAGRAPRASNTLVRSSGQSAFCSNELAPASAGTSLKPQHYSQILSEASPQGSAADFFEVHAENYFGDGGAPHRYLTAIRERFALSIHGIGLSIGGAGPLDRDHLAHLRALVDRYEPALVSEHLAWCENDGTYFNDLLPVTLTSEALDIVCRHVDQTQETLGRRILIENPSNYLAFEESDIPETAFLSAMARRTGCGLLLDINNVVVSAHNLQTLPRTILISLMLRLSVRFIWVATPMMIAAASHSRSTIMARHPPGMSGRCMTSSSLPPAHAQRLLSGTRMCLRLMCC